MVVTMHMEACLQGIILNVQLFTMVMSMAMMISGLTVELQKANIATGHKMTRWKDVKELSAAEWQSLSWVGLV